MLESNLNCIVEGVEMSIGGETLIGKSTRHEKSCFSVVYNFLEYGAGIFLLVLLKCANGAKSAGRHRQKQADTPSHVQP
jgi:hypothetical protein